MTIQPVQTQRCVAALGWVDQRVLRGLVLWQEEWALSPERMTGECCRQCRQGMCRSGLQAQPGSCHLFQTSMCLRSYGRLWQGEIVGSLIAWGSSFVVVNRENDTSLVAPAATKPKQTNNKRNDRGLLCGINRGVIWGSTSSNGQRLFRDQ